MRDDQNKPRVIPKEAYIIAGTVYVLGFAMMRFLAIPHDPKSAYFPEAGKFVLSLFVPLVISGWILLIGYVFGDAKRRGMRHWLWTLLAIFIPDAIGIILYFILRDPLPFYCSSCGASLKSTYTFCPNCSAPLRPTCTQCGRGLERGWKHCPNCGTAAPAVNQNPSPGAQPASGPI
jgi:hypothetical protein